jgi:myosin heavy subunit
MSATPSRIKPPVAGKSPGTTPGGSKTIEEIMKQDRVKVFIPSDELVWISAEIVREVKPGYYEIEFDDPDYKVTRDNPLRKVITMKTLCRKLDSLPLQNTGMTERGVDDMTALNYLHEASILDNLRRRFTIKAPYTYTGNICIAVSVLDQSTRLHGH